ncbi:MAG TPA: MmgE/PrpD family protein [Burkholderiaceae bacterium]|nr:MmgE/PrpD family protein [Burkholderiaceae bacterium]
MNVPLAVTAPAAAVSRTIAAWAAGLSYDDLPPPAIAAAKRLILDTLGCAWAGWRAEGAEFVPRLLELSAGAGESAIWGSSRVAPPIQAALANGVLAAALDFDSVHNDATVHAGVVVLPAVLALAQRERLDGRRLLAAFVAGSETLSRLGLAVRSHPGWFYTSVLGVYGAAAGCGNAMRFDADRMLDALGIAMSRSAGTQQPLIERSLTKRLQSAFAARDGLESALLAGCGVGAPRQPLEGRFGTAAVYAPLDPEAITRELGERYTFADSCIKAFPSCLCNHAAIDAALRLHARAPAIAQQIDAVTVDVSEFIDRLVGAPFEPGASPQVSAQFSLQYSVACALARGRLSVGDIETEAVCDPALGALAARVAVRVAADHTGRFAPVTLTVRLRGGQTLRERADDYPGAPGRPVTDAQLRAKVRECLMLGERPLTAGAADRLIEQILRVDELDDVAQSWFIGGS